VSASEKLKALENGHFRIDPIFRKAGPKSEGADAFARARDIEKIMDALPQIVAVVEALTLIADHGHEMDDYEMPPKQARKIARAALSALEEALT
jgi:hypothetical protein